MVTSSDLIVGMAFNGKWCPAVCKTSISISPVFAAANVTLVLIGYSKARDLNGIVDYTGSDVGRRRSLGTKQWKQK